MPKPRIIFIEARSPIDISLSDEQIQKLPDRIGVITTIQHLHKLKRIKEQMPRAVIGGQVLGCDASAADKIKDKVDAYLYIGTGRFHPIAVLEKTGKDVFCYNPETKKLSKLGRHDLELREKRQRGAYLRFLTSSCIGVLVTTKQGQDRLKAALGLKKMYPEKEFYYLISDSIDFSQLENFTFVKCFVNTACPRLCDDYDKFPKPIINLEYIEAMRAQAE